MQDDGGWLGITCSKEEFALVVDLFSFSLFFLLFCLRPRHQFVDFVEDSKSIRSALLLRVIFLFLFPSLPLLLHLHLPLLVLLRLALHLQLMGIVQIFEPFLKPLVPKMEWQVESLDLGKQLLGTDLVHVIDLSILLSVDHFQGKH